jgi:biotin operon repressor
MTFIEQLELLQRIDAFINRKGTGTAAEFAERLKVSRRSIFNYLDTLRRLGAEIDYCEHKQSYFYRDNKRPHLPTITKQNANKISGGESFLYYFSEVQNFCTPTSDLCIKLKNTEEQNDAGGFRFSPFGY